MTIDSFVQDAATGLLLPPLARKQVLPYGDLQILNQPETLQHVTHDLISALAVLVAQAPDRPRLLGADVKGRLRTSGFINQVTALVSPFTGGGTTFNVADSSDFYPGQLVAGVSQTPGGPSCNGMVITGVPDIHTIIVSSSCVGQNFVVGDLLIGTPDVRVASNVFPNSLTGPDTLIVPGAPNPGDSQIGMVGDLGGHKRMMVDPIRSADATALVANVSPGAAIAGLGALGAGFAYVTRTVTWILDNRTAAAVLQSVRLWDGLSGTGVLKWFSTMQAPANSVAILQWQDINVRGSSNTQVTLDFSGGAASVNESISGSFFYEKVT